ncbi:MAG: peptide chain release factor N(5)-glutamine methyltransferase [Opitutales bacterium]|nr:peptide chain release factor N(5)-glutamine methyltransferase [Opitutales bacterium]
MQTLLELLKKATTFLEQKGVGNARLNAELIFANVLACRRFDLYLQFERPLTEEEKATLRERLVRRGRREPVQYIVGDTDFRKLTLKCDPRALIPRPETEELVDCVLDRLGGRTRICDLGTGTGAIALSLAKELSGVKITAVDFSKEALSLAKENAQRLALDSRVDFVCSDWLDSFPRERMFDAIVSNPPYLTEEEWKTAQEEVRDFEPRSALVSEDEGCADCEKILAASRERLFEGGFVALETGIAQHLRLEKFAREHGFQKTELLKDYSGRERFFVAWI